MKIILSILLKCYDLNYNLVISTHLVMILYMKKEYVNKVIRK